MFLLQHKYHVHTSLPTPRKKEETLSSDLLMVRHDGKKLLLQLGRFALESLPVNFALLTTRSMCGWSSDGAVAITKPRSLSCSGILLWTLSPSHHWLISEGWNKNAACPSCMVHVQSLINFYQNEAILFKWRVRERR